MTRPFNRIARTWRVKVALWLITAWVAWVIKATWGLGVLLILVVFLALALNFLGRRKEESWVTRNLLWGQFRGMILIAMLPALWDTGWTAFRDTRKAGFSADSFIAFILVLGALAIIVAAVFNVFGRLPASIFGSRRRRRRRRPTRRRY